MASATGVPERNPAAQEEEPLLGGPGDATQQPGQGLQWNFVKGTGKSGSRRTCMNILLTAFSYPRTGRYLHPDGPSMGRGL